MEELLTGLIANYPALANVFIVIGILRAIFKPLMTLLYAYVNSTENTKDNDLLNSVEQNSVFKFLVWLLDYTTSIKLPPKKSDQ